MSYEIQLIKKDQLQTTEWAGGTTTQLAIYPKDAIYKEGNFKWRLSSAKVEVEESVFTSLPNVNRIIMVIEGKLRLEHEGHHHCLLEAFQQDHFSGSWTTKSYGKVTDFNLMMKEGCEGELEAIHLDKEQFKIISLESRRGFPKTTEAIYCVKGQVTINLPHNEKVRLSEGDIILISSENNVSKSSIRLHNETENKVDLISSQISY